MASFKIIIIITIALNIIETNSQGSSDHYSVGMQKHDFAELISIAIDFFNQFPNTDLYFLGQSLAWIGKVMEIINKFTPSTTTIHYVPFSGSFLQLEEASNSFIINHDNFPSEEEIKSYQSFLRVLGLAPKTIISRFEETGRRTVIADYIFEGKGMASFLYILKKWEEKKSVDFGNSLGVVVLTDSREYYKQPDHVLTIKYVEISVNLMTIFRNGDVLDRIRHPEEVEGFERLVVPFEHEDWTKKIKKITLEDLPYNVEVIQRLTLFVENYYSLWKDFENLMEVADHISSAYFRTAVYFLDDLGWVGRVLDIRSFFGSEASDTYYIPFSASFTSISLRPGFYTFKSWELPTKEETINYQNMLRENGLDPKVIHAVFVNSGGRTVIAGNGLSESKLASFLYFLFRWAMDEGVNLNGAIQAYVAGSRTNFFNLNSEFIVPCTYLDTDLPVLDRLANSEDPDFVSLSRYYPPSQWNEPPETFDEDHIERVKSMDEMLKTFVQTQIDARRTTSTLPTLVLRPPSDQASFMFDSEPAEFYVACTSGLSRNRRNLKTQADEEISLNEKLSLIFTVSVNGSDTFNMNLFKNLNMEYDKGSRNVPFVEFIKKIFEDPLSAASKALHQSCEKFHSKYSYDIINENEVYFSSNKSYISWCMSHHRLFRCNQFYESEGTIGEIAESVAKKFSGKVKTTDSIGDEVKDLVYSLSHSPRALPPAYIVQATKEAALFCSDKKILSTLDCPHNIFSFIVQIIRAFFGQPFEYEGIPHGPELVLD